MRKKRTTDGVVTDYSRSLIRFKARQLSRQAGFNRSERKDLEQDLWVSLLSQADNYDEQRSSVDTYCDRVVNTAAGMLVRERHRKRRADGHFSRSLDATPAGEECDSPCECISEADNRRRNGTVPFDQHDLTEDEEAVQFALDTMSPQISDVCRRVMGGSIKSAARDLGTSRRQIRKSLTEAQPFLERAGFSLS